MKNTIKLLLCFLAIFSLPLRSSLIAMEKPFEINALVEFVSLVRWEPGVCTLYINPDNIENNASYSFPQPITLRGFSSSSSGWQIKVESDYVNINNEFLLLSEDRQHVLRYVFTSSQNAQGGNSPTIYKHGDTVIERKRFNAIHETRTFYATLLPGQANKVPGGYYTGTVTAAFYDQ